MSEKQVRMYVESVSSKTVTLENTLNDPPSRAGVGVAQIVVTTVEGTAEAGFWGTTGTCAVMQVIFRKVD